MTRSHRVKNASPLAATAPDSFDERGIGRSIFEIDEQLKRTLSNELPTVRESITHQGDCREDHTALIETIPEALSIK